MHPSYLEHFFNKVLVYLLLYFYSAAITGNSIR